MNVSNGPATCWALCFVPPQSVEDALPTVDVPTRRVWTMDRIEEGEETHCAYKVIWHIVGGYDLIVWETHHSNEFNPTLASLGLELLLLSFRHAHVMPIL